ncbi:MAG: transferrin receptor-like dimerization domain-containing protein, partial [Thermoanaerobaculia bacterium]|nr:transferrin receptor-like dimerization domain-containing protein [Thermoanaerobaculia bacterium]
RRGWRPLRSLLFAHWGAEEQGIIGSVEWVERHREELLDGGVAYVNLDSATRGLEFGASAAPSLKTVIEEVARAVEHPDPAHDTVYDQWLAAGEGEPSFGNLGGGSDHVGFYCHVGVPSCGLGAGGAQGTSYHSNYDTLAWYRQVVGDDYEPARMLTRMVSLLAGRLAAAPLLPLDPVRYATDARRHVEELERRAVERTVAIDLAALRTAIDRYEGVAKSSRDRLLAAVEEDLLTGERLDRVNERLLRLERVWLREEGLPERPWFRNLYAATDQDSGYAAWMLPALRWAVERRRDRDLERLVPLYVTVFGRLGEEMAEIGRLLEGGRRATSSP